MKKFSIIGIIISLIFIAASCNNSAQTTSSNNNSTTSSTGISQAQVDLRQNMRKLWTDHVVWTREYIKAAVAGSADATAAANRLMQNQEDIGNAVAGYYGDDAGSSLTTLLKDNINIAVDLVNDAKAKNQSKFNADNAKWQDNASSIAEFLANANPNWSKDDLNDMMLKHLSTTADEVNAIVNKDYTGSVDDFDAVYNHILTMADTLSDGIIKQFPDKF